MSYVLPFLLATFAVLVIGLLFMAVGGKGNKKYGSKLMSLRVAFQAAAVASLFLVYLYGDSGG